MTNESMKMLTVVGARPQFVKAAVVARYLRESGRSGQVSEVLVHTGQHYDAEMSDVFFQQLDIPQPRYNLEVGSGRSSDQLARMVERLAPVMETERPDIVLVYGDTNSTLAASLVAAHMNIPLAHVEAGERIFRRFDVPEEVNRILTDHTASLCLTSTERATRYLLREGMAPGRVRFVGDPMYELFLWGMARVHHFSSVTPATFGLCAGQYFLATVHRAQNTRDAETLVALLSSLDRARLPVVLPVHPRVRALLERCAWAPSGSLKLVEPLGYFDFMSLLRDCQGTISDSGGVTRESFFAHKPCVVPMESCWWPEVVEAGWICEAGSDPEEILKAVDTFEAPDLEPPCLFGDGRSAEKIVDAIDSFVTDRTEPKWHRLGSISELPSARPSAFTYASYKQMLLNFAAAGYSFLGFPEAEAALAERSPFVLLRHDIDIDLDPALRLAELEARLGIRSTYFFMVRTRTYNLFSARGTEAVSKILRLNHHLGLHFDCAAYPAASTVDELAAACAREVQMLGDWFGRDVSAVSYHRPGALVLTGDPALSAPKLHTYQRLFTGPITYLSDSRGCWSRGSPLESEAFQNRRPLHVLVHPIWWNERALSPFEVLERYTDRMRDELALELARNCAVYQVGRLKAQSA